ncbi:MAG: TonB C-terminal domain-containing protein [Holophagaceae bacterium]|nr:TonB C-terminal domain-containing protein [Holophagaceae bacterium]
MVQELHTLLKRRSQISLLKWPTGLGISFGLHSVAVVSILLWPNSVPKETNAKIRWVTIPTATGGVSGGSTPTEMGETSGRQRRVEELAPAKPKPTPAKPTPQPPKTQSKPPLAETRSTTPKPPVTPPKVTNPNQSSRGTATETARSTTPAKTVVPGAAGSGGSGGVGHGAGIPGLRPTNGALGGTGILQEFIGADDFPLWYAQQIQDNVTRNWIQMRGSEGRVQIYFRILKTGKVESIRIEISSGKADLDDLALQAVRRATLPRLPEEFEGESLGVRFWFNYSG